VIAPLTSQSDPVDCGGRLSETSRVSKLRLAANQGLCLIVAVVVALAAASCAVAGTTAHHKDPHAELSISPILLSASVAIATVALHLLLKFAATPAPEGKRHGLVREDLVWWRDWVVVAVVSLAIYALSTAASHATLSIKQTVFVGVALLFGIGALPPIVKAFGYTQQDPPAVRTFAGIVIPNVAGALILMATIASGATLTG
jgi:hypothetical protein